MGLSLRAFRKIIAGPRSGSTLFHPRGGKPPASPSNQRSKIPRQPLEDALSNTVGWAVRRETKQRHPTKQTGGRDPLARDILSPVNENGGRG
eukprot:4909792-Pyramimonas_sp.AAC.2